MNLAQVLHQRWAADEALNQLLPASRVYTGLSIDPSTPYAVILRRSDRPVACFHDGSTVDRVGVRVELFHDSYDAGVAVAERIKAAFHLAQFALSGSDKVLCMQRTNDFEQHHENGLWRFVVDFNCTVLVIPG